MTDTDPVDPRDQYDDLLVDHTTEAVEGSRYDRIDQSEAARSGWIAGAVTIDPDGRVLLVYDVEEAAWGCPGGMATPGETPREAAIREVREETGIDIEVVRPEFVRDITYRHEHRTTTVTYVLYSATAPPVEPTLDGPAVDPQLTDVAWFESLPPDTTERDGTARVLKRARERTGRPP